jgi:hypothetical protein
VFYFLLKGFRVIVTDLVVEIITIGTSIYVRIVVVSGILVLLSDNALDLERC